VARARAGTVARAGTGARTTSKQSYDEKEAREGVKGR